MNQLTHITVLLDRTGSMSGIREDVIGGFNTFLAVQQAQPTPATFTLVQFDSQDPYEVLQSGVPVGDVRPLTTETYVPRASTPLYDAVGRGIIDLEASLEKLEPAQRPGKVVFVIVTDGQENASKEFSRESVMASIEAKRKLEWEFVFLSADAESFADAKRMGVDGEARLLFSRSKQSNDRAWASTSSRISEYRDGVAKSVRFNAQDRSDQDAAE